MSGYPGSLLWENENYTNDMSGSLGSPLWEKENYTNGGPLGSPHLEKEETIHFENG